MPILSSLVRKIIERAREDIRDELRARHFPAATPTPMSQWLAQLDARIVPVQASAPPPDENEDEDDQGDEGALDYDDFDCRR